MMCFTGRCWPWATIVILLLTGCRQPQPPLEPAGDTPDIELLEEEPGDPGETEAAGPSAPAVTIPRPSRQVTASVLKAAIDRSGRYLVENCDASGRFQYLLHPDVSVDPGEQYNVLRHLGAIYGLARYHRFSPSGEVARATTRSVQFLRRHCLRAPEGTEGMLAIWSDPELVHGPPYAVAKLGGAALALVALDQVEKVHAGTTRLEEFRQLGRFILSMQKKDGSFYSLYIPSRGGLDDEFKSQFYPGEAAFGLLLLSTRDPEGPWLQAAADAVAALARQQLEKRITTPDHWTLMAGDVLLANYEKCQAPMPRAGILDHLRRTAGDMLNDQLSALADARTTGCYTVDGQTCPTATRLEGLLALLSYLPAEDRALADQTRASVQLAMSFLLRSQVRRGSLAGGFPCVTAALSPDDPRLAGLPKSQVEEIRIDYVQHALCAMIRYHELLGRGRLSSEGN